MLRVYLVPGKGCKYGDWREDLVAEFGTFGTVSNGSPVKFGATDGSGSETFGTFGTGRGKSKIVMDQILSGGERGAIIVYAIVSFVLNVSVVINIRGRLRKCLTMSETRTNQVVLADEANKQALMKVYLRREQNARESDTRLRFGAIIDFEYT